MKQRTLYTIMTVGGVLGMVAAFTQTLEKLVLLQDSTAVLPCNFNAVFSCSTVLSAWQSSVFGFPNSIMCLTLFTIFTTVGLVGATGGVLSRGMRLGVQFLSLFTLGFALWFLWQSVYEIGALCIFCLVCFTGLLMINWAWLRANVYILPFGRKAGTALVHLVERGFDTFIWVGLGLVVALAMFAQFGL